MQKETTLLNNDLFEDLASKYPDFNFNQCIPSEQDFEKIALRYHDYKVNGKEADYISTPWGLARSTKSMYKQIRYFIVAILIGYTELIAAYKKELQTRFKKEEMQEIVDTIIKTNLNSLSQYAGKYAVEKNESLQEASSLTPLQKMQAFNNGTRKENVKACGDEKLINYYNICCSYNLTYAKRQLEIELARRGMQRYIHQPLKGLTSNDFTDTLVSMLTKTSYTNLEQLCETQGTDFAIVCLIFAICLDDKSLVTFLKNWLTQKAFINIDDIKVVLGKALKDPKITQQIASCISNLNKTTTTESLEENIEKHDTLNPKLWNEDFTLKSEVKDKILEIVKEFENNLAEDNIKFNVKDIILVGSNVNYNYTKDSDLDIHIITDTTSLNCPDNLYPALYSAYRSLFNKNLNIEFYGIPVELYIETEESPRVSNGCYSVSQDKWISEPKIEDIPEYDKEQLNSLVTEWETKYNGLLNKNNLTADDISSFIEQIYELRKEGLASGSEWNVKNLTFKEFRNKGYLDHLKELKNEVRGKELSLESLQEQYSTFWESAEQDILTEGDWNKDKNACIAAVQTFEQDRTIKKITTWNGKSRFAAVWHHLDGQHDYNNFINYVLIVDWSANKAHLAEFVHKCIHCHALLKAAQLGTIAESVATALHNLNTEITYYLFNQPYGTPVKDRVDEKDQSDVYTIYKCTDFEDYFKRVGQLLIDHYQGGVTGKDEGEKIVQMPNSNKSSNTDSTLDINKNKVNSEKVMQNVQDNASYSRPKSSTASLISEDTEKVKDHKWVNKGKEGTHGEFKTKKEADAQRKAMFANGFHEDYKTIEQYKTKLRQITHYIPMIQENGLFELYNIPETDVYPIMSKLNQLPEVEWVQKSQSSFDFNHFTMSGQPRSKYKIYGQLKIK